MLKILLIKTSSLGDVIHVMPALTDLKKQIPDAQIDWVVEEAFADMASWHPAVDHVMPVAIRRWRKRWFSVSTIKEVFSFVKTLRKKRYDLILDAQGLTKSAIIGLLAKGSMVGLNRHSARDSFAPCLYQKCFPVSWGLHAVSRQRNLFSQAFSYALPSDVADYGIRQTMVGGTSAREDYVIFLHGTTWVTKHWPENYWCQLASLLAPTKIYLPWGNEQEKKRANLIAKSGEHVSVLPKSSLRELVALIAKSTAVVAVDTGLGHLSAAVDTPTVSLYGATDPKMVGTHGQGQIHLTADFPCSPCIKRECSFQGESAEKPACFTTILPSRVVDALKGLL
ncbi:MAG: heptosyltransferase I [marine bacterium B5-7]|nr:MAG: heptosyltransferase I [marine bacterium B5-7]